MPPKKKTRSVTGERAMTLRSGRKVEAEPPATRRTLRSSTTTPRVTRRGACAVPTVHQVYTPPKRAKRKQPTVWSTVPPAGFTHVRDVVGPAGHMIYGVTYNRADGTLVTCENDPEGLVKVYDAEGALVRQLGRDIPSESTAGGSALLFRFGPVAVDTRRRLYLLPSNDGNLVRMDGEGGVMDITMVGNYLHHVAYAPDRDVYVVSNMGHNEHVTAVLVVCPVTMTTTPIIVRGDRELGFHHVCVAPAPHGGATTVVVSRNHEPAVTVYSLEGEPLRTYRPEGLLPGRSPRFGAVCADGHGSVFVCCTEDIGRNCLLRLRCDGDAEQSFEVLFEHEQLPPLGAPWRVAVDSDNRQLAIAGYNSIKIYQY